MCCTKAAGCTGSVGGPQQRLLEHWALRPTATGRPAVGWWFRSLARLPPSSSFVSVEEMGSRPGAAGLGSCGPAPGSWGVMRPGPGP